MKIVQSWIAAQGDPGTDGQWQGCSNVGSRCVDQDYGHLLRISDAWTPFCYDHGPGTGKKIEVIVNP